MRPRQPTLTAISLRRAIHDHEAETVVTLAADSLQRSRIDAALDGQAIEEPARADDDGVGGVRVEDGAVANDVIADDDRAGAREAHRTLEVGHFIDLVGMDEDEVEGRDFFGMEPGKRLDAGTEAEFDFRGKAGRFEIGGGDLGVLGADFERDEMAVGGKGAGEPDGAVSAERSDFKNAFRTSETC